MLYTNMNMKVVDREMPFGILRGVSLGERGRGRREEFLPVPASVTEINWGLHKNLSVGLTRNGKPRINLGDNGNLYLILSSQRGYTRRGDGVVYEVKLNRQDEPKVKYLAEAWGADGAAGRIGTWEAKVLEVKPGAIVKVIWAGDSVSPTIYFVDGYGNGYVTDVNEEELPAYYDHLGLDMPDALK